MLASLYLLYHLKCYQLIEFVLSLQSSGPHTSSEMKQGDLETQKHGPRESTLWTVTLLTALIGEDEKCGGRAVGSPHLAWTWLLDSYLPKGTARAPSRTRVIA